MTLPHSKLPQLSPAANEMMDWFHDLEPGTAPAIEPGLLTPFCAEGDTLNISGPAGCGKTTLAADIILAAVHPDRQGIALGGLMRFPQDQAGKIKVAVLDAENCQPRWNSLLTRLIENEGLNPDFGFKMRYIRPDEIELHRPTKWEQASQDLALALAYDEIQLVIGDSLGRIWAPDDINSSAWVQRGFSPFRADCQQYGITCVMLTHTRRRQMAGPEPTGPIGSSFQEGQADAQLMMARTKARDRHGIKLTLRKCRRAPWIQQDATVTALFKKPFGYEPQGDWQTQWPHECPDFDSEEFLPDPTTRDLVLGQLKEAGEDGISRKEISDKLGLSERTARENLSSLAENGLAEKLGSGPNTTWRFKECS